MLCLCYLACLLQILRFTNLVYSKHEKNNNLKMATGCENWTFLVCNLAGSRTHFKKCETIHPFSKSNQGKLNLERIWLGTWKNPKIVFYDNTFITQTENEQNIKMIGLISHLKWKIWIRYWTIKNKACTQFVLYYSSLI